MSVISYKLSSAHLPADLIARQRLEFSLTRGLEQNARLIQITAAAGYGKTTLIGSWLQTQSIPHIWVTLEKSDDNLGQFTELLQRALGAPVATETPAADTRKALDAIVDLLRQSENCRLLVLDRFENIRSPELQQLIFSLAEQLPPHKNLAILSRRNAGLPVSRMRASNQLVEMDERDLAFNLNETRQLCEKRFGRALPAANLDTLQSKTQGWAAGMRLASDLLGSELEMENSLAVANFSGTSRFMGDYFIEEVFSGESPAMQDFLVKVSLLDAFSPALCRALLPSRSIENMVAAVKENHLFCVPFEGREGWLTLHPLFRDFLQARCNPDDRQVFYRRAAGWFQQHGQPREAVQCSLKSGDENTALQVIEPACEQAILEGDISALTGWLDSWAKNGFAPRAELLAYQGWNNALKGDFVQALVCAERAEEQLKNNLKGKKQEAANVQVTNGKLAALRAFIEVMYSRKYDAALREAKIALKLLPKNRSAWTLMALWAQAETQKRVDHIGKSIETLYEALRIGKSVGGKTFTYAIANSLAAALHFNGRRAEALELCQKTIARSPEADDPALGGIYAWSARLNFEANRLDLAREFIEKALNLNETGGVNLNLIFSYYYASQIYQASGESMRALQAIQQAQSLAGNATLSDESWLNAWEANLNLAQGNILQVEHWLRKENPALAQKPDYLNMEMLLVHTRYLARSGNTNEAAKRLREMEKLTSHRGYFRWLLTVYLLQGIIWEHSGKKAQALDCIKRAIHLAAPEEYQRAFLDEDPLVLKLLPELAQESPAFIMRLLRSASSSGSSEKKIPASILPEALSTRESEILRLLIKGRKGPQISEELFISYSTVRTHIKSIHRKLDVHNRHELVEKARLLELA